MDTTIVSISVCLCLCARDSYKIVCGNGDIYCGWPFISFDLNHCPFFSKLKKEKSLLLVVHIRPHFDKLANKQNQKFDGEHSDIFSSRSIRSFRVSASNFFHWSFLSIPLNIFDLFANFIPWNAWPFVLIQLTS